MNFLRPHRRPSSIELDRQYESSASSLARADEHEDFDAVDRRIPDGTIFHTAAEIIELRAKLDRDRREGRMTWFYGVE